MGGHLDWVSVGGGEVFRRNDDTVPEWHSESGFDDLQARHHVQRSDGIEQGLTLGRA